VNVEQWALSPEIVHLNHGSYGGCHKTVIAEATRLRTELEAAPMKFFGLAWQGLQNFIGAASGPSSRRHR